MNFITKNFLFIAIAAAALSLVYPPLFTWAKNIIPILLGLIMFGMGLTLEFQDFAGVYKNKRLILIGTLLQFAIMPITAVAVGKLLQLPKEIYIGMLIVGACPGGTASNVIVYLGKGNVPLSIVLTFVSTLLAPILTPAIIYLLLNQKVDVSFWELFQSVLQIVAFPLITGLIVKHYFGQKMSRALQYFPAFSTLCITLIIACVMGLNQKPIITFPYRVFIAVILHNGMGLMLGYYGCKLLGSNEKDSRTVAIEVGMQNSGLGVALANQFFTPLAALPGAIFSLWHNLSGIALANFWAKNKLS